MPVCGKNSPTVPGQGGRAKREGIVLHRSSTLRPCDITRRHNIPLSARDHTRPGLDQERTRSDLERKFLRLLHSHELPLPEVDARLGPDEIDFLGAPSASRSSSTATPATPTAPRSSATALAPAT